MFTRYNQKNAFKRFEVAIKLRGQLYALSYGMPSNNKLIEGMQSAVRVAFQLGAITAEHLSAWRKRGG